MNNTPSSATLQISSSFTGTGDNWSCFAFANYSGLVSATNHSSNATVIASPAPPSPSGGSGSGGQSGGIITSGKLDLSSSFDCYLGRLTV